MPASPPPPVPRRIGKDYNADVDFTWNDQEEPHRSRRMEILRRHPEIKQLYGPEWKTKYMVGATVALQVGLAVHSGDLGWPAFLALVYVVGATANHSLLLAIHEWSHNLGFSTPRTRPERVFSDATCDIGAGIDGPADSNGDDQIAI